MVAREVTRKLDMQTGLPANASEDLPPPDFHLRLPDDVAEIILWGAILIGVGLIGWVLSDSLPRFGRSSHALEPAPRPTVLPLVSIQRLEEAPIDADELARQGRIVEAMHLLLLRGLAELRRSLDMRFADSLTNREILSRLRLPEIALSAFADIVARVEFAYFGDRQTSQEDYLSLPQKLRRADLVRAGRRAWLRARSFRAGSSPRSLHA